MVFSLFFEEKNEVKDFFNVSPSFPRRTLRLADLAAAKRAEEHQAQPGPRLAQLPRQRHAIHLRHVHVEDRHVVGLGLEHLQGPLGGLGVLHHHAPLGRLQRQDAPGHRRHLQADTGAERQRGSRCGGGMSGQPLARGTWPAAVAVSRR